ncbi:MAG: hypothetical protein AAF572_27020 [Cyanobacteria bacterium P01_B01_bin.77]
MEILAIFDKARGIGYGKTIPGKLDNDFKELAEIYSSTTADEAKDRHSAGWSANQIIFLAGSAQKLQYLQPFR